MKKINDERHWKRTWRRSRDFARLHCHRNHYLPSGCHHHARNLLMPTRRTGRGVFSQPSAWTWQHCAQMASIERLSPVVYVQKFAKLPSLEVFDIISLSIKQRRQRWYMSRLNIAAIVNTMLSAQSLPKKDGSINAKLAMRVSEMKTFCEIVCSVLLVGMMLAFCWMCCIVSGYHWE